MGLPPWCGSPAVCVDHAARRTRRRLSRTFGGAQSRRDEAQRLGSAAPLSIFRAAPIAKWQQAAGLPKNAFTSNGITALGLLPFHQKGGRAIEVVRPEVWLSSRRRTAMSRKRHKPAEIVAKLRQVD